MMKILLTGSNGMVGRNILEHPKASQHFFWTPSSKEVNLLDETQVRWYISSTMPDLIIHAAGQVGGIQANIAHQADFLTNNLLMGLNVLRIAREYEVPRVINLSSSCVYPKNVEGKLEEDMLLTGQLEPTNEGYAIAKLAVQKLAEKITEEDSLQYKTLIPCNLYGRWDKFDPNHSHMLASVITKVLTAKANNDDKITIWGDGKARREFMYAADLADCIFRAVEKFESVPTTLNVGPGIDHSVDVYYRTVAHALGWNGHFEYDLSKPTGMQRKLLDTTRLNEWGWQPQTPLTEGIKLTNEFLKTNHQ